MDDLSDEHYNQSECYFALIKMNLFLRYLFIYFKVVFQANTSSVLHLHLLPCVRRVRDDIIARRESPPPRTLQPTSAVVLSADAFY